MRRLASQTPQAVSGAAPTPGQASRRPAMPRALRTLSGLPLFATRSLLLPALSCALLTGMATGSRADDTAKADKPAETKEQPKTTDTKTEKTPAANSKSQDKPDSKTPGMPVKAPVADKSAAVAKSKSLLTPLMLARLQDAAKQDTGGAAATQGQGTAPAKPADQQPAPPAAPAGPTPGTVTITGLADFYYGINARAPHQVNGKGFYPITTPSGETISSDNFGEFFNINDREPSFSLGEVNISRTEGRGVPFGITATLTFGDAARLYHATEPGGTSSWQMLHNLYVTKGFRALGRDVSIDFGKWATPIGLEVLESSNNDNYSRAFNFWYGVPFYHAGLRATVPLSSQVTVQGAVVNGWNNVADDNDAKSIYGLLTFKPNPRVTANFSLIGGAEGTGAYGPGVPKNKGSITTNLFDTNVTWQVSPLFKLSGWASYGNAAGSNNGTHISGNWLGLVAGARYQITPSLAIAGRLEQFEDMPGTGGAGPRFGLPGYLRMREGTLTLEYTTLRSHLVTRLEYRHDASSQSVFGAGAGTSRDQDTVYLSEVIRF